MKRYLPLTLLAAVACDDPVQQPSAGDLPPLPAIEVDGVRAAAVVESVEEDRVTIAVRFEERGLRLGAYQARLTFDPKALELLEASVPNDGQRFHNAERAAAGLIRFAGFSVDGFAGPQALSLRFKVKQSLRNAGVGLNVEVVGTLEGTAIAAQRVQVLPQLYVVQ